MRGVPTLISLSVFALLTACATSHESMQNSSDYKAKQKIAEANNQNMAQAHHMCPRAPEVDDNGELIMKKPKVSSLDETIFFDFEKYLNNPSDIEQALNAYVADVSFSDKPIQFNATSCWTGEIIHEAIIGELKHPNRTWVNIILFEGEFTESAGDRRCAYAENPNAWTYETCPPKGSVA